MYSTMNTRGGSARHTRRATGTEFRALAWLCRHPGFLLTPVLLGLAVWRWGPLPVAAVVGAVVLAMIALGPRGRTRVDDLGDALPVPTGARFDPGWLGVLQACVPSTVGVAAMAVVALVVTTALAALLGGVLLALGGLAAVAWMQLAARERGERRRYWVERGPRPRVFVS